jgi:ABC-type branched-subunit amino acid transport system permease subunit
MIPLNPAAIADQLLIGATFAALTALAALGLRLHWRGAGLLNLGPAAFLALGGYVAAWASAPDFPGRIAGPEAPFGLAALIALASGAVLGGLVWAAFRRAPAWIAGAATLLLALAVQQMLLRAPALGAGQGIAGAARPFSDLLGSEAGAVATLALAVIMIGGAAALSERLIGAAAALSGGAILALAGAMTVGFTGHVGPQAASPWEPMLLLWTALLMGERYGTRGVVIAASAAWALWAGVGVGAEFLLDRRAAAVLPSAMFAGLLGGLLVRRRRG